MIRIIVDFPCGKMAALNLQPFHQTVDALKDMIEGVECLPRDQLYLSASGQQLVDGNTLIHYNVGSGSRIKLFQPTDLIQPAGPVHQQRASMTPWDVREALLVMDSLAREEDESDNEDTAAAGSSVTILATKIITFTLFIVFDTFDTRFDTLFKEEEPPAQEPELPAQEPEQLPAQEEEPPAQEPELPAQEPELPAQEEQLSAQEELPEQLPEELPKQLPEQLPDPKVFLSKFMRTLLIVVPPETVSTMIKTTMSSEYKWLCELTATKEARVQYKKDGKVIIIGSSIRDTIMEFVTREDVGRGIIRQYYREQRKAVCVGIGMRRYASLSDLGDPEVCEPPIQNLMKRGLTPYNASKAIFNEPKYIRRVLDDTTNTAEFDLTKSPIYAQLERHLDRKILLEYSLYTVELLPSSDFQLEGHMALPLVPLQAHPSRPSTAVWAVGRFVFAYDTATSAWEQPRRELHSDAVRALDGMAATGEGAEGCTRWVSAGDDKEVKMWEEKGAEWTAGPTLSHHKKLTCALFDPHGKAVFADRFGDIYRWEGKESSEAELLCSHLAIVTALAFSPSGKYLISADNHEKVRVNCYTGGSEIRSFCLGHTAQITAVAAIGDEAVLSASADGSLRLWSLDGEPLARCELGSAVSSLSFQKGVGSGCVEAVVGCEAPLPAIRRVKLSATQGAKAEVEVLAEEAPQAVCVRGDGSWLWVDRRGHLRTPAAEVSGPCGDVFQGEDLPPATCALSKNAGDADADAEGGVDEDGEAKPEESKKAKKRGRQ
ncbi:unnamed protein product [Polarella glacialis]|uniref:Ubiquitin-like domain-containing protein n=1 Tax=Polarella glacialis TaxID=89957 RepID=A0A813HPA2_POLGL|nr:unnamed protein product [Polarella glacialis]